MSYCDCDYDPPTFHSSSRSKARKTHRCDECRGPIEPGETYRRVAGLWDARPREANQRCGVSRMWTLKTAERT